jgi:hypothetical protein
MPSGDNLCIVDMNPSQIGLFLDPMRWKLISM